MSMGAVHPARPFGWLFKMNKFVDVRLMYVYVLYVMRNVVSSSLEPYSMREDLPQQEGKGSIPTPWDLTASLG